MYIPSANRVEDADKLTALIRRHSSATVITHDGQSSFASHLPVLCHPDTDVLTDQDSRSLAELMLTEGHVHEGD